VPRLQAEEGAQSLDGGALARVAEARRARERREVGPRGGKSFGRVAVSRDEPDAAHPFFAGAVEERVEARVANGVRAGNRDALRGRGARRRRRGYDRRGAAIGTSASARAGAAADGAEAAAGVAARTAGEGAAAKRGRTAARARGPPAPRERRRTRSTARSAPRKESPRPSLSPAMPRRESSAAGRAARASAFVTTA